MKPEIYQTEELATEQAVILLEQQTGLTINYSDELIACRANQIGSVNCACGETSSVHLEIIHDNEHYSALTGVCEHCGEE